jgi:hypothetical protein
MSGPAAPDAHGGETPKESVMKNLRRGAIPLAALLTIVSLVCATREGSAGPAERKLVRRDPPLAPEMNGPDIPPLPGPMISCRMWLTSALLGRGIGIELTSGIRAPKRHSDARLPRYAPRLAVKQ